MSNNFRNEAERRYWEQYERVNKQAEGVDYKQKYLELRWTVDSAFYKHFEKCSTCELCQELGFLLTERY